MSEFTKKDLEQALGVQTKQLEQRLDKRIKTLRKRDLEPIAQTLVRATGFLAKLSEDFKDSQTDLKSVPETLNSHTTALDAIYKNTQNYKAESASVLSRMKRHERWIAQIAEKVHVRLEGLDLP